MFILLNINREYGDVFFQPANGPGRYHLYYMPYTFRIIEGSGDYRLTYDAPKVEGFQDEKLFDPMDEIPTSSGKGWL